MIFELGDVIAERDLLFKPIEGQAHSVTVRLGRPVPHPLTPGRSWCCPYQIVGMGRDRVFGIFGVDTLQALVLALHTIPGELAAFARARGGQFLLFGEPDTTWLGSCRAALDVAGDVLPVEVTPPPAGSHRVDVRQPAPFLRRVMRELAGDARLSLEGTFGEAVFPAELIVSHEPVGALQRSATAPQVAFLVLRLEPDAVATLFARLSQLGLREDIVHVQIEKHGRLELRAYDNFHSDCVLTGGAVDAAVLAELEVAGIVRSFAPG